MVAIKLLELCAVLLALYVLISQIIVPGVLGRQLFPFFRREQKLREQIAEKLQEEHEERLREMAEAFSNTHGQQEVKTDDGGTVEQPTKEQDK